MNLHADVCIQNGTTVNRQYLVDCVRDSALGKKSQVVYIYSLENDSVCYPNKAGNVIYIGEACRSTEPTGKRFSQHISTGQDEGGDTGTIYALSRYYWLGKPIRLKIFLVNSEQERIEAERQLLNVHVKEYGALPICQGTTGKNYKTSYLSDLKVTPEQLALLNITT